MAKGFPFELTAPEQRRSGKPSPHNARKPVVTGASAHAAHDYKLHSKPRSEQHTLVGNQLAEWTGNVPTEGTGSLDDLPPQQREQVAHVNVGGHAIDPELLRDRARTAQTGTHFLG
ncbi:hypothetical protein HXX76_011728 [Chlamydomonas incerta]|nr:hypothetical protein HXX76_011728 [Chlamydomonas incerta]|eukprot:KAG2426501.1 hypothetical protein HXX76_011728 [Chlamydomonas incerta]